MKASEFNITSEENGILYLYNTLSGAVIALEPAYSRLFYHSDLWLSDENFADNMIKGGFLIPDERNERAWIRKVSEARRSCKDKLIYTIAPTLECNFRCPYCYEYGHRHNTMTPECVDKTIEYLKCQLEKTKCDSLQVTWYGGEPLLRLDAIRLITESIKDRTKYNADIVTNGYLLTEETAKELSELQVKYAQVTIDGPPDIHNARRCLPSGKDTFFRILENVSCASKYIHITIRVNVDRTNTSRLDELIGFFDKYGLKERVSLYLAAVGNINGSCIDNSCLADAEFSELEIGFLRKNINSGYTFVHLPRFNPNICGAVNKFSEVIDPLGNLYKCWNEVGRKEHSYGSIYAESCNDNLNKWNDYDFEAYGECSKCKFLPVCMGGCPHENLVEKRKTCRSIKLNCVEMIGLARDYKIELSKRKKMLTG